MPRHAKEQQRITSRKRSTAAIGTPERKEMVGRWYLENMVEGDQSFAPDLPNPLLIQTACLPSFRRAVASRTTAYHRLVGSLQIVCKSFRVWEETQDMAAVLREAVAGALGVGHRSAEEIGAALSTLADDSAAWKRYLEPVMNLG